MRVSLFFVLISAFQVLAGASYSQTTLFTLSLKNSTVQEVLGKIEDQSTYYFLYNNQLIDVNRKIDIDVKNEKLEMILSTLFSDGSVSYQIRDRHIILSPIAGVSSQQQKTITGKIVDVSGTSLPGVTVIVKGTTIGTITDMYGKYSLSNIPENGTLLFSFVGMKLQEVVVGNKTTIDIKLEDETIGIEEVVAVGYGVQKKSQVTGAISSVKAVDIVNRTFTDASQAIQGKTAGVQIFLPSGAPGSVSSIRVRGLGSNSNNDPLYVVDGRQVDNINDLSPDDISSMEILKDAASAAIYGARAGNGVILVTTKSGNLNTKGTIDYEFMDTWQTNNNIPTMLNAKQYYDYQNILSTSNSSALDIDWGDKTTDTDWLNYIFGTGHLARHNISLSGGSEKAKYYTAFSINTNDGPVITNKDRYDRYTGTFNTEYQVKNWLKFTSNNQISLSKVYGNANVFQAAMQFTPLVTPTVGVPNAYMAAQQNLGYRLITDEHGQYGTIPSFSMGDQINPIISLNRTNEWNKAFSFSGSSSALFTPFKDFLFTSRFGYQFGSSRNFSQSLPGVYGNQSSSYNQTVSASSSNGENYQLENFASYTKSFEKSNASIIAGMSYIVNHNMSINGSVNGTGNDVGWPNTDPLYAYFAYRSGAYSQTVSGGEEGLRTKLAYYGRFNYDFANKYFLQASLRADAADLASLPESGRWGYFPAASIGWTLSNEEFMKNISQKIPYLKIRASWGQNGSTAGLNGYSWQSVITSASNNVYPFNPGQMVYTNSKYPSTAGNKSLKWETSEQTDIGFDLRLLDSHLLFTYDWYNKTTKDLILTGFTPSYIMGIAASPFNAGKVSNIGNEFDLSWRDKIGNDFNYSIATNFTTLKNEVKEITSTLTALAGSEQDSHTVTWFEQGYPMWHFKTYHFTGLDELGNPQFQDVNGNGTLDVDDKVDAGSGIPTFNYGITLSANYKNFDLTVFGAGQGGNKIMQIATRAFSLQTNVEEYLYTKAWTPENTNTRVPRVGMNNIGYYYVSDAMIYKGDYFKLKQAVFGYTLPKNLTRKILIDKLRVYASVENAFTITKYPGFDPEIMSSGNAMGIDAGRYPNNRNYTLGVNITF